MIRRALLLALTLAACGDRRDIVANSVIPDGAVAACVGDGPVLLVAHGITVGQTPNAAAGDICTGTVAVRTFPQALCTCEGYATATTLTTDSFDSTLGPYAPGGTSGDVALDGGLSTNAQTHIDGDLVVAGTAGTTLHADLHVAHDLLVGGPLAAGVAVTAGGNAQVAGNIDLASLAVAGTLTVPATSTITGAVTAGQTVRAPVSVTPPCACEADQLVDIAAFIAGHATDNQDAQIGLTPGLLTGFHGPVSLDLQCGVYYVGPIHGDDKLTLRITGRVALLVDGDATLTAPFDVELATDDAELDLLIGGTLSSGQAVNIGRADHPSRTRVYIAGTDPIQLSGDSQVAANLYAPRAALALSAQATVYGSLFVRRLDQSAPLTIHYDVDVRRADIACPLGS